MKRKNIKLFTTILIMLSFLITGGMFAYWSENVSGNKDDATQAITIGVGENATTTVDLTPLQVTQGVLVPVGYEKEGSVSEIVITYSVKLLANEDGAVGAVATLGVTIEDLPHTLLVVTPSLANENITVGGDAVVVTIKVVLTEPENVEEYNEVAGKDFSFKIVFEATIS